MGRRSPHTSKNPLRIFFWFLVFLIGTSWYVFSLSRKQNEIISPLASNFENVREHFPSPTHGSLLALFSKSKKPDELRAAVKKIADEKWKNYSIYVVDLTSAFEMGMNETSIYDAASVNKIPILVTLYHEASEGNIDFNRTITMQEKDRQDYGTGSMRYDPSGTVYSIKTLARLMIQKSDNTAAYIIANHILKLKDIQAYVEGLGTTQTDMIKNTTSNRDIALLFRLMFEGKIANKALTEEMVGLLKKTDFEDRLPAQLPDDAIVYHKIGTGVGAVHDVGVVENGKTKYYIGIFTSNILDEEQTSEEVAQVSKLVYEFMTN